MEKFRASLEKAWKSFVKAWKCLEQLEKSLGKAWRCWEKLGKGLEKARKRLGRSVEKLGKAWWGEVLAEYAGLVSITLRALYFFLLYKFLPAVLTLLSPKGAGRI